MTTHACSIDEEHFNQWLIEMRTTASPQCMGKLKAEVGADGPFGFCCLGLGTNLIDTVEIVRGVDYHDLDNGTVEVVATYYLMDGSDDLAPDSFARWLSGSDVNHLGSMWSGNGHDVHPDIPSMKMQGKRSKYDPGVAMYPHGFGDLNDACSAASMNDDGFTFAQIADVFAYFGVRLITT